MCMKCAKLYLSRLAFDLLTGRSKSESMKAILWTSHLVSKENVEKYIDKSKYIVQIWSKG